MTGGCGCRKGAIAPGCERHDEQRRRSPFPEPEMVDRDDGVGAYEFLVYVAGCFVALVIGLAIAFGLA